MCLALFILINNKRSQIILAYYIDAKCKDKMATALGLNKHNNTYCNEI